MPKIADHKLTALALMFAAAFATSASAHKSARSYAMHSWHHHRGDIVLRPGYARRGPATGYRFGFATYRGDPFARDDYYDGHNCYYLHHRDFCLSFRKPLGLPH